MTVLILSLNLRTIITANFSAPEQKLSFNPKQKIFLMGEYEVRFNLVFKTTRISIEHNFSRTLSFFVIYLTLLLPLAKSVLMLRKYELRNF